MEVIKLTYPIVGKDGKEITELSFPRLKLKDLKLFPKEMFSEGYVWDWGKMIPVIASMLKMPEETVGEIDASDLSEIVKVFTSFFVKSQETGKNVSGQ
jgi:hypothetical protein